MASTTSSLLAVLVLVAVAAPAPAWATRCPQSDKQALLRVKQSLGNPATLSTWSPGSADCCAWDHVRCDEAGRVNNVFIDGADDVHGQIPSAVAGLTALMSLSLFRLPGLSGSIPACLTALSNLQFLTISHTNVSGTIPDSLARIHTLDSVDLSNNQLTGCIPNSFSDLPNLRSLDLRRNQLTGQIPAGLVQGQFRSLILSYNQLTGPIPRDDAQDEINTVDLSPQPPHRRRLLPLRRRPANRQGRPGMERPRLRPQQAAVPAGAHLPGPQPQPHQGHRAPLPRRALHAAEAGPQLQPPLRPAPEAPRRHPPRLQAVRAQPVPQRRAARRVPPVGEVSFTPSIHFAGARRGVCCGIRYGAEYWGCTTLVVTKQSTCVHACAAAASEI
ncbi:hypothetical protein GUJ93_ZPchr0007g3471 [Zizania palustris]|uniref:Leucine-rich repeat-containing N-terminal plant-type domain-containing protein n=1 Tax=Zizania palustris TaxID=103762 RepID=A0A8J5VTH5_ZIZPA|nr:hypothetical protein GUJ93_ZPchr0007g3471 [Zizania palustris]